MDFTVVGATGFVGSHLVRHLRGLGATVQAPARGDARLLDAEHGHLIYCAGYTNDFLAAPAETVEAHVGLLTDLLRHGRFGTLTYLSSTRLYDFGDGSGHADSVLRLSPHQPRHVFDLSKALGESLCIHAGRANARAVRLSCVYGGDLSADNFLHQVIHAARAGAPTSFDVAPDTERDYVHIDDVCRGIVEIACRGRRPIYNLAAGANISNAALFETVRRLTGARLSATRAPSGMRSPVVDVAGLREDFGLTPWRVEERLAAMLPAPALGAA